MSCRQLSPRLAVAILLVLTTLALPAVSAGQVRGVSISTDQTDYVNVPGFNIVTADAVVTYVGNNQIDNVRFDWFDPGASLPFRTFYVAPSASSGVGRARDVVTVDREGMNFTVTASINETIGSPPVLTWVASFNVHNRTAFVTVRDLVVTTNPVYENNTLASARADLTWSGNGSLLGPIRFEWFAPDWTPLLPPQDVPSAPSGTATSSWGINREGSGFHVNATYLAGTPVTNTTDFDVISQQVTTMIPGDLTGNVVLDSLSSPYGVCTNISITSGAQVTIQAGVIIRFCPNTGLFVNGTLTVDALWNRRVYFLPLTAPGAPMQKGHWRGINFTAQASPNSLLSNAVVQGVTTGVVVRGTSITIVNSLFALASKPAIWLVNSTTLIGNNTIADVDTGLRVDGTDGIAVDANRVQGAGIGIHLQDSNGTLSANNVSLTVSAGLRAVRSNVTVRGGTFRDPGNAGIELSGVPRARIEGVQISGGNDSMRVTNSRDVLIEASTFTGARFRSLFTLDASATLVNSTLVSLGLDLQLLASTVTTVNTTFAREDAWTSVLTVRYFLHVLVETTVPVAGRFQGAWVNVTSDATGLPARRTNANGWAQWILLTQRLVNNAGTKWYVNTISVSADGYSLSQNPRNVNMSASHVERFVAAPLGPNSNPPIDPLALLVVAVVLGSLLIILPVLRRRRREERPATRGVAPHQAVLEPGTAYLLPDEKPDRAFEILAAQVAKGSKGLVITRIYPEEVRRRFRLMNVPVLWLSRGYGKDTVNPTNLGALVNEIERFVSGKEDSVVLLDGLEYLLVQNDTQKVVKFVQTLADSASVHHTKVLLPFNEKSVGEAERALLTRDLQIL